MSGELPVSLVVPSRNRPDMLNRLLLSLRYQSGREFEVVVVTNGGPPVAPGRDLIHVPFDKANLAAARNAGIRAAKGEIIVFCDDDCVPEPRWIERLTRPFADDGVAAAGGYVIGRNGIGLQFGATEIDASGAQIPSELGGGIHAPVAGRAISTTGVNCAFRRSALNEVGGFDESFRYYLEESDANWRLSLAGWKTALVPEALVHHSLAESDTRNVLRAPTSLYEIAASKAVFLRKNLQASGWNEALDQFRATQKKRLCTFFSLGSIDRQMMQQLMQTLETGLADGFRRPTGLRQDLGRSSEAARTFADGAATRPSLSVGLFGGPLQARRIRAAAAMLAARGHMVSVFLFWLNALPHRVSFTDQGFWLHRGGVYARIGRSGKMPGFRFRWQSVEAEIRRISSQRTFDFLATPDRIAVGTGIAELGGLEGFRVLGRT